jgi:hypothetical protein
VAFAEERARAPRPSFAHLMHPRNRCASDCARAGSAAWLRCGFRYRQSPDFAELAQRHPSLREHLIRTANPHRPALAWSNPAVRNMPFCVPVAFGMLYCARRARVVPLSRGRAPTDAACQHTHTHTHTHMPRASTANAAVGAGVTRTCLTEARQTQSGSPRRPSRLSPARYSRMTLGWTCTCRRTTSSQPFRFASTTFTGSKVRTVPVQMWQGRAPSRCRCGSGEPSPDADVEGASPVPAQMCEE